MDIRYDREGHQIAIAQAKSGDGTAGMTRVNYDRLYRVTNYETHGTGLITDFSNNTADPVTGSNPASSYYKSLAYDKSGSRSEVNRSGTTKNFTLSGYNLSRIDFSVNGALTQGTTTVTPRQLRPRNRLYFPEFSRWHRPPGARH